MAGIQKIGWRRVINSHVEFTNEFVIELDDGSLGVGASPQGETISIYEGDQRVLSPEAVLCVIQSQGCIGLEMEQQEFDNFLQRHIGEFGRNNVFSLSLAFFNAKTVSCPGMERLGARVRESGTPRLCCNILNGSRHAYTNPVLSDFAEYLLVARSHEVEKVIELHGQVQRKVREKLRKHGMELVSGNPVYRLGARDNRECLEFLLAILGELGLGNEFDLMVDASAGDLWTGQRYQLAVTDNSSYSGEEFGEYWAGLIREFGIGFLEDPFGEKDQEAWRELSGSVKCCHVIGDNFYSSDALRIEDGSIRGCTHGVIIKPNQAGTITAACRAVEAAQRHGQLTIASHRSVSTEETFVSTLSCIYGVDYIKIGPLMTDYSSVMRLNSILRWANEPVWHDKPASAPSGTPIPITTPNGATPERSMSP